MLITNKITVDMNRRGVAQNIDAVQGDSNTRAVEITLTENGAQWQIPNKSTAAVAFSKPDGTRGLYDELPDGSAATTVSGNTVTAILAPQVLTCAGTASVSVVFYDADGDTLATFPFRVTVEKNPAAGKRVSNDYYAIQNLAQANAAYNDLISRVEKLEAWDAFVEWNGGSY